MINRLLRHPKVQNSKLVEYSFRAVIIVGICWIVVVVAGDLIKAARTDKDVDNKKQCLGKFDTVPCHQLRIEQLLLESRRNAAKQ